MPLTLFSRRWHATAASRDVYAAIVRHARLPGFYRQLGIPDTVDGRFELICVHAFLVMHRLKALGAARFSQVLFDTMFEDMDRSLREMGAGDLGVGRRVKTMAKAYYGRIAAYEQGLSAGRATLVAALKRNVYGTVDPSAAAVEALADYVLRENTSLADLDESVLLSGRVCFGEPPDAPMAADDRTGVAR